MASFFTPLSRKEPEKTTWRIVNDSLLIGRYRTGDDHEKLPPAKRRRIAGFDFVTTPSTIHQAGPDEARMSQDSTLIQPASGNKHAKDATDWKWWHASVPGRLKALHADG